MLSAVMRSVLALGYPAAALREALLHLDQVCSICHLSFLLSDLCSASASLHLGTLPTRLDCHCKPGFWQCRHFLVVHAVLSSVASGLCKSLHTPLGSCIAGDMHSLPSVSCCQKAAQGRPCFALGGLWGLLHLWALVNGSIQVWVLADSACLQPAWMPSCGGLDKLHG